MISRCILKTSCVISAVTINVGAELRKLSRESLQLIRRANNSSNKALMPE